MKENLHTFIVKKVLIKFKPLSIIYYALINGNQSKCLYSNFVQ